MWVPLSPGDYSATKQQLFIGEYSFRF